MMSALECLLALGLTPEEMAENQMTTAGWCVMTISITAVLSLLTYCLYTTLSLPPPQADTDEQLTRPPANTENE
ncbi:hypothetical protein [Allorhodopirellula solitaria]|uniref:Uncharacterized protein n=1 Tax=Allorhodopirellula solitaria TaxID=2527987 RepID=A0A5C5YFB3_9BACT|nr:hypothetical protein [Allorhodopirellula solitaria]TWT73211.1 hypothetical protein CA85_16780 [Allorhodopirellula solitaria]